jgi:UDP-N-acetylmuramate dehydrogenase
MLDRFFLPKIRGSYKCHYNLSPLTWFKVGGKAEVLFKPADQEDLMYFLKNNHSNLSINILGAGSNVIIRDGGVDGVVVKLGGPKFTEIAYTGRGRMLVGAGCLNFNLAQYARINSLTGLEFLVGIPGTIGGGIAMNAGAYCREFKDIVAKIYACDLKGKLRVLSPEDMGFIYRGNSLQEPLIFMSAEIQASIGDKRVITEKMKEISEHRAKTQPVTERTSGSSFANPPGEIKAWELIDAAGMRGFQVNGAMISEKHCNFMINTGTAKAQDLEILGEMVRAKVLEKFQVNLKWEIKIIGKNE